MKNINTYSSIFKYLLFGGVLAVAFIWADRSLPALFSFSEWVEICQDASNDADKQQLLLEMDFDDTCMAEHLVASDDHESTVGILQFMVLQLPGIMHTNAVTPPPEFKL
jgi:hypothetical protein